MAFESGLDRFIRLDKGQFIGREGSRLGRSGGVKNRFVTLEVLDVNFADARGSEAILKDGKLVGRATSGGGGWHLCKSLALAMVQPNLDEIGTELDIVILGKTPRGCGRRVAVRSGERPPAGLILQVSHAQPDPRCCHRGWNEFAATCRFAVGGRAGTDRLNPISEQQLEQDGRSTIGPCRAGPVFIEAKGERVDA